MKEDTRRRLSELILEELSDKIRTRESLRKKLEAFSDLPVEKVADAILKQFEYVLSSDLRDLIIYLIEQEVAAEEGGTAVAASEQAGAQETSEESAPVPAEQPSAKEEPSPAEIPEASERSIMAHFGPKEPFPVEPMDIPLKPDDWLYLYGCSYAPDSTGKGVPTKKLGFKGVDGDNNVFLVDYGDVRFYLSKLTSEDYTLEKSGKPTLTPQKTSAFRHSHEKLVNILNAEDVIVAFPFWTIIRGREHFIEVVEDKYVELLRALIDAHDAGEWDVEVFAFDEHIIELPSIAESVKGRAPQRDSKHQVSKSRDVKLLERLMVREKTLAQEIHSELVLHSTKAKIDYMIRLDNAFMDDWKSILAARYSVGKEKRKVFCQTIRSLQEQYKTYGLMIHVANPNIHFTMGF